MFGLGKIIGPLTDTILHSALSQISVADQRKAFIAIMLATASKAAEKPNFNIELEMNDLWTKLQNLKRESAAGGGGGIGGIASIAGQAFGRLSDINGPLQKAAEAMIKNLPRP